MNSYAPIGFMTTITGCRGTLRDMFEGIEYSQDRIQGRDYVIPWLPSDILHFRTSLLKHHSKADLLSRTSKCLKSHIFPTPQHPEGKTRSVQKHQVVVIYTKLIDYAQQTENNFLLVVHAATHVAKGAIPDTCV